MNKPVNKTPSNQAFHNLPGRVQREACSWIRLSLFGLLPVLHTSGRAIKRQPWTNQPSLWWNTPDLFIRQHNCMIHTAGQLDLCIYIIKGPHGVSCLSTVWQIQCRRGGWGCCAPHPEQRHGHMTSRCLHSCQLQAAERSCCYLNISFSSMSRNPCLRCILGFIAQSSTSTFNRGMFIR